MGRGWIGVDLDGTLARSDGSWHPDGGIGDPVDGMVTRVMKMLGDGVDVRIFTARVELVFDGCDEYRIGPEEQVKKIEDWCERHLGRVLPITCVKDYRMTELYDDRARQVEKDEGWVLGEIIKDELACYQADEDYVLSEDTLRNLASSFPSLY